MDKRLFFCIIIVVNKIYKNQKIYIFDTNSEIIIIICTLYSLKIKNSFQPKKNKLKNNAKNFFFNHHHPCSWTTNRMSHRNRPYRSESYSQQTWQSTYSQTWSDVTYSVHPQSPWISPSTPYYSLPPHSSPSTADTSPHTVSYTHTQNF